MSKPAGFLEDYSRLREGNHFKQEYRAPGADFTRYEKVKINPVELRYFQDRDKLEEKEVVRLALQFEEDLKSGLGKKYRVLEKAERPDEKTFVISTELVSVETPPRGLNVVTSALIWVPVANGSAAFEAKISDGASGELLAEIAEKRSGGGDAKSLTVGPYAKFVHAEAAFKKWASELAAFTGRRPVGTR